MIHLVSFSILIHEILHEVQIVYYYFSCFLFLFFRPTMPFLCSTRCLFSDLSNHRPLSRSGNDHATLVAHAVDQLAAVAAAAAAAAAKPKS